MFRKRDMICPKTRHDMFENEIKNLQQLILTPYQFKIDIYCFNIQFQPFFINIWCNFDLLILELKIHTLEIDNFADLDHLEMGQVLVLELISPGIVMCIKLVFCLYLLSGYKFGIQCQNSKLFQNCLLETCTF